MASPREKLSHRNAKDDTSGNSPTSSGSHQTWEPTGSRQAVSRDPPTSSTTQRERTVRPDQLDSGVPTITVQSPERPPQDRASRRGRPPVSDADRRPRSQQEQREAAYNNSRTPSPSERDSPLSSQESYERFRPRPTTGTESPRQDSFASDLRGSGFPASSSRVIIPASGIKTQGPGEAWGLTCRHHLDGPDPRSYMLYMPKDASVDQVCAATGMVYADPDTKQRILLTGQSCGVSYSHVT